MRYYSARSRLKDGGDAIEEVLHSLRAGGCESADMLALFVTSHHRESVAQMAGRVEMDQSPRVLIGTRTTSSPGCAARRRAATCSVCHSASGLFRVAMRICFIHPL